MKIFRIAKEKNPYKIVLVTPGGVKKIGDIEAYSDIQARRFFLERDTRDYSSYLEMGYTIKAVLDEEELKRREIIREHEEEQIQEAWWQ